MIKQNFFKKGLKAIKEKRYNFLLFGIIYFILSLKNEFIEKVRFYFIKKANKGNMYKTEINGSLMMLDFNDKGISKELSVNKKRERFGTDFMKTFVKPNDIIVDIGANIGYYALLEGKKADKGMIYAVEPIPKNNSLLRKNVELNNYKNVSVFQYAVGDKDGIGRMNVCDKGNWCSFTKNPNSNIVEEIEVPLITLDSFVKQNIQKNPNLVRMDVEGYECQIIKGMKKILNKKGNLKIFMELHPPWLKLMSRADMNIMLKTLKNNNLKIKAIFIEVAPYNYRSIKFINWLRRLFNLPEFGFAGNSYEDLDRLLKHEDIYTPLIFFERN